MNKKSSVTLAELIIFIDNIMILITMTVRNTVSMVVNLLHILHNLPVNCQACLLLLPGPGVLGYSHISGLASLLQQVPDHHLIIKTSKADNHWSNVVNYPGSFKPSETKYYLV